MPDLGDMLVFWAVVIGRLFIPLLIPLYPLPAVLAALVLDGVDQTIFQVFTNLPMGPYQTYDKALDIYYLVIAYLSTMRNWVSLPAFRISRFLLYYRLAGTALFELTQIRALLLIFPNTFEYFFIFYEAVRARWNPLRLSAKQWLSAAAAIWIFIKLPQEYWIHVAKLDATDQIKTRVFGVALEESWTVAFANRPWVLVIAAVAVVLAFFLFKWLLTKLPPKDWPLKLKADPLPEYIDERCEQLAMVAQSKVLSKVLLEKLALVALVGLIFANLLPRVSATNWELYALIGLVVVINAFLSHWLAQRRRGWRPLAREFVVMSVINLGLTYLGHWLIGQRGVQLDLPVTLFMVMLLTLMVVLFDRYRVVYEARLEVEGKEGMGA